MYINEKNISELSSSLKKHKHLRISNFLTTDYATKISDCLKNEIDWGLACRLNGKPETFLKTNDVKNLSNENKKLLKLQINEEFQFIYNSYMMVTAYIEKRNPNLFLNKVLEWLNHPDTIKYFKTLTKDSSIIKINAQATRYLPGHFLTQHNDENEQEGRLYAYVIGFSENWNPDWGGLLSLLDSKGNIVSTLIPEYNSLSIFKVPQNHFVSYVSPMAKNPRLAITGWLLAK